MDLLKSSLYSYGLKTKYIFNTPFLKLKTFPRTTRIIILVVLAFISLILLKGIYINFKGVKEVDPNNEVNHFLYDPKGKYITLLFHSCGGLANILYRYASIYGIGKKLGRLPFIDKRRICWNEHMPELMAGLPEFAKQTMFLRVESSKSIRYDWGKHCCKFDDVQKLGTENPDIRFLQVTGNILQSYKYFHDIKPEIRRLMTFSDDIKSLVETYTQTMFKEDTKSHKLCVHTRLGDFKTHFLQESTLDFVNPALELLGRELKEKYDQVSVVLMGEDFGFLKQVNTSEELFNGRYYLRNLNRMEEIYFGSSKCDSLLMTASGSTFSWWMAYLRPEESQDHVYYNVKISKLANWEKDEYDYDAFPSEWQRLRLTKTGNVVHETRWHNQLIADGIDIL